MGRRKIELKRIESSKERSSKYSKRKKGLLKKADEMAVLCDVDIALILVSPTDKPTLFHSRSKTLGDILEKFSSISLREREERRDYTNKTLKKLLNKNTTEISIENDHLSTNRDEAFQDDNKLTEREARELLIEKLFILREWQNPYKLDDLDRLKIMKNYLVSTLNQIRNIKRI